MSDTLTYKGELIRAMNLLAKDQAARFIGYGVLSGRAMGTIKDVPAAQLVETPVAENLMVGLAIGMSLKGLKPLVFIERCDFLANAMDALVNHLDKIEVISRGEFKPTAIIRVVVGNRTKGLQTGATHVQDFGEGLSAILENIIVVQLRTAEEIFPAYQDAIASLGHNSTVLIEYKDLL